MSLLKTLADKSWERKGIIGGLRPVGVFETSAEKVALVVFLIVASVIFSLFTVSYFIRMELPDWAPLAEPAKLWMNTGLLVISSMLFQWAHSIVSSNSSRNIKTALIGGGVFAVLFIAGQLSVWEDLNAAGYYIASNPATDFFYLLTGIHALHLLGGLWVWSKSSIKLLSGSELKDVRLSIQLCTLYWHFLLIVWLILFAILSNT